MKKRSVWCGIGRACRICLLLRYYGRFVKGWQNGHEKYIFLDMLALEFMGPTSKYILTVLDQVPDSNFRQRRVVEIFA